MDQPNSTETAEQRAARPAEEDRLTEEAEEEVEREGTIPAEEVFAWLRSPNREKMTCGAK